MHGIKNPDMGQMPKTSIQDSKKALGKVVYFLLFFWNTDSDVILGTTKIFRILLDVILNCVTVCLTGHCIRKTSCGHAGGGAGSHFKSRGSFSKAPENAVSLFKVRFYHRRQRTVSAAYTTAQNERKHSSMSPLWSVFHVGAVSKQTSVHCSQSQRRRRGGGGRG